MALDHPRNTLMHRRNCRQLVAIATRTSDCLCRYAFTIVSWSKSFWSKNILDLRRRCRYFFSVGLSHPNLGNKKIWRYQVWRVGMYNWFPSCVLDGAMGSYYRAIRWGICRWVDRWAGFKKIFKGCVWFFCRFSPWLFFKTRGLFLHDLLDHQ